MFNEPMVDIMIFGIQLHIFPVLRFFKLIFDTWFLRKPGKQGFPGRSNRRITADPHQGIPISQSTPTLATRVECLHLSLLVSRIQQEPGISPGASGPAL